VVERLRKQLRHAVVANTLAFVAVFALVTVGLYYVDQRDARRQRDICGLITLLDVPAAPAPTPAPPAAERQKKIANAVHQYRVHIGCDQVPSASGR
jgi:hypothetical protein